MRTDQLITLPESVPKVLDARGHAVVDYLTAGSFLALGFAWRERHRGASTLALIHGGSVLMASLMTDYPGGVFRTFSFQTHRMLDVMQSGLMALGPSLMGFAGEPEAQVFHGQALLEGSVIAATDWSTA